VEPVAKLIYDVCEADGDVTVAATPEDLESTWKTEDFNLDRDVFIWKTGWAHCWLRRNFSTAKDQYHDLDADGYIHPEFRGLGIGTHVAPRG